MADSAGISVELVGIAKSFPGVVALDDVTLTLHAGHIHALVGENGAGKSTLINILGGYYTPERGEIRLDGKSVRFASARAAHRAGIVVVPQEVDLFSDLSVAENIGLEQGLPSRLPGIVDWIALRRQALTALDTMRADVRPETLASTLTPAQRQVVLLGAAVSHPARVLVLDEPTSSLSGAESALLFDHLRRLRKHGTAILYVSHRLEEIFALADEVTVLRDGRRAWHGTLADTTPAGLIRHMVGRDVVAAPRSQVNTSGPVLFRCSGLTAADGSFTGVELAVRGGEVVGLYGLVGAGRTEWAQAVVGIRELAQGEIRIAEVAVIPSGPGPMARFGVVYVPEDRQRQGLCRGLSVRANTVLATLRQWATAMLVSRRREAARTDGIVATLGTRLRSIEQAAGTLSGGNQQKIVVGRWLERQPRVLLLDEPTRGIDVGAKGEIYALIRRLAGEGRAIVLISSDLPEVLSQSDRVGVFRGGRLAAWFDPRTCAPDDVASAAMPAVSTSQAQADTASQATPRGPSRIIGPTALREAALAILIVLLFAVLQWRTGRFLDRANLENLATDTALLSLCALGSALVLLGGGIDISLGSIMALSAGVAGQLWEAGHPLPLVVLVGAGVGAACGVVNAGVSLAGRVHPIVVTLGTLSLYRGALLWWLDHDVRIPSAARDAFMERVIGLPLLVWIGLIAALATTGFLSRTIAGRHLIAVGSNPTAAARAGVSLPRAWLIAFGLQGMLAGLAGLLFLARSGLVRPVSHENITLDAIAAAVVGGVAITGGRGTVLGVVLGTLFLVSLGPACLFLNVPTTWQRTLVGTVMASAVVVDALWRRRT
jgi:ABC-type sugar transport system ATPase subunit/ribose/xylose/arabinose/galactoside ABC-type transport system permease subunit